MTVLKIVLTDKTIASFKDLTDFFKLSLASCFSEAALL